MHSGPEILDPADTRPESLRFLRDWLALQWALALQPTSAAELVHAKGGPRAALAACTAARRATPAELSAAERALRSVEARGVPLTSGAYPPRLARLRDPALLLWVRGSVEALSAPSVAIVGSRAATSYGLHVARQFAADFARAGVVVVSGLALGIDAAAHRGALEANGRTVAVLARGLDRVYPARHTGLAAEIEVHGAVVSELPPGTNPLPQFFPLRNRLISALASAVVIVEARERSGTLITAEHAANQGAEVFAVPGPIHAPTSAGPNRLLKEGAGVALGARDVLDELNWTTPTAAEADSTPSRTMPSTSNTPDPGARAIIEELERGPASDDELVARIACAPDRLALDLFELESSERVFRARDGLWHLRPSRQSRD